MKIKLINRISRNFGITVGAGRQSLRSARSITVHFPLCVTFSMFGAPFAASGPSFEVPQNVFLANAPFRWWYTTTVLLSLSSLPARAEGATFGAMPVGSAAIANKFLLANVFTRYFYGFSAYIFLEWRKHFWRPHSHIIPFHLIVAGCAAAAMTERRWNAI